MKREKNYREMNMNKAEIQVFETAHELGALQ